MAPTVVGCFYCGTPLRFPPGISSIRCGVCYGVTHISVSHYDPPSPPSPPSRSNKRAVICGVSHKHTRKELKGSINDVKNMKQLLIDMFSFHESSICMLTEDETDPSSMEPTKENLKEAFDWLVSDCRHGDSLVFYFSGHGSRQIEEVPGDEVDGYDERIHLLDGYITDNEINAMIVRPLLPGVKLHAIIDACFSGTVLDLPYLCRMDRTGTYYWEDDRPLSGAWKGTNGGEAFCFSGCDDDQNTSDYSLLSRITPIGSFTLSFIEVIKRGGGTTYGEMLEEIRSTVREVHPEPGLVSSVTSFFSWFSAPRRHRHRFKQEPQLTATEIFDVYSKRFSL